MDGMITLILLLLGSLAISTLVIGGYSVILYLLIQKIPGDRTRLFFPILVAAILIAIYPSYDEALWSSIGFEQFVAMGIFFTIIRILPLLTLIAMASIAPFPLIRKCIGTGRSYILIAVAAGIGIFVLFARGFTSVFGPTQTTPDVFVTVIPPSLFLVFPFLEVVVYSAALFGFSALLWYFVALPHRRWFRGSLFCIAAVASLFLLEWAAVAGLGVIIYSVIKQVRNVTVSCAVAMSVGLLLAVAGPVLMKIPEADRHFPVVIIPLIVAGCAIASTFSLSAEKIRRDIRLPMFLSGAILSLFITYSVMEYALRPTGSLLSWLVTIPGEPLLRLYLILMFSAVFASAAIIFWIFVPLIGWYLEKSTIYNPGRKLK